MLGLGHNAGIQMAGSAPHWLFLQSISSWDRWWWGIQYSQHLERIEDIWNAKLGRMKTLSLRGSCLSLERGHFCVPKTPDGYSKIISRPNDPFWSDIGTVMCPQ